MINIILKMVNRFSSSQTAIGVYRKSMQANCLDVRRHETLIIVYAQIIIIIISKITCT